MSSSDKNKSSGDDRDETSREPDSALPQGSGSGPAKSSETGQGAADKRAPESAEDDDFIPRLSTVRSRHLEENVPDFEEEDWETERAQKLQHFDPSLGTEPYLVRPGYAPPHDEASRGPDLSAAVLAIEMAAVTSFDSLPVTTVRPNNVEAQNFPERNPFEPGSSHDEAEHLSPEFGYHKEVAENSAQAKHTDEPAYLVGPSGSAQGASAQRSEHAPPNVLDSLISQSGELDELWASLDEGQPAQSAPPSPGGTMEARAASVPSIPDEIAHANKLYAEQRASLAGAANSSQPAGAISAPVAETPQERQARSVLVRRSLYWVVQEARLVTHGVFADFEQRADEDDATAVTGDNEPVHLVSAGRDATPPAVAHAHQPQPDQSQQPPIVSQLDAYPQAVPSPAKQSPAQPSNARPGPRLVGPDTEVDDFAVDDEATVMVSGPDQSDHEKQGHFLLKPELTDGPIKPDIAISHRPGALTPVPTDAGGVVDQRVTDQRMRDQRTTAQRSKDQSVTGERPKERDKDQRVTAERARDQRITSERSKDQRTTDLETTDQRTTDQRTTSDGKIKLPLLGFVEKEKIKKGAITVGSVALLSLACVVLMYESITSSRNTETPPGPELQKPDSEPANEPGDVPAKTPPSQKADSEKEKLKLAFKLEQDLQYTDALEQFDSIIAGKGKDNPKALHGRGRVLTKLQRYQSALEDLESAAEKDPKNELVLIDLAAVKYLSNDYSGAAMEYERIISAHPNDVDAIYGRGISYAGMLKWKEAIADFENVVKLRPSYDKAYRQMCTTYLAMGQADKAEAAITVAMKACGPDADLYFSRGLSRYQMGRKETSLEDYDAAIKLSPKRKEYYNDRGYVFMDLGRIDEARKDFQKALEIDPKYKLAVDNLRRLRKLEKSDK